MAVESGKFAGGILAPVAKGRLSGIPKAESRNPKEGRNPRKIGRGVLFGFREAIAKVTPLWYSHDPFPLTPALSLQGEGALSAAHSKTRAAWSYCDAALASPSP